MDWSKASIKDLTWTDAVTYCKTLSFNQHQDWRLPTASELIESVEHRISSIKDPNFVGNHFDSRYWSSYTSTRTPDSAWYVNPGARYFDMYDEGKAKTLSVICVRGS